MGYLLRENDISIKAPYQIQNVCLAVIVMYDIDCPSFYKLQRTTSAKRLLLSLTDYPRIPSVRVFPSVAKSSLPLLSNFFIHWAPVSLAHKKSWRCLWYAGVSTCVFVPGTTLLSQPLQHLKVAPNWLALRSRTSMPQVPRLMHHGLRLYDTPISRSHFLTWSCPYSEAQPVASLIEAPCSQPLQHLKVAPNWLVRMEGRANSFNLVKERKQQELTKGFVIWSLGVWIPLPRSAPLSISAEKRNLHVVSILVLY